MSRTWKKFDYSEKVKFCEEHKKIFTEKVTVKCGRYKAINAGELEKLMNKARYCVRCRWETIFGR